MTTRREQLAELGAARLRVIVGGRRRWWPWTPAAGKQADPADGTSGTGSDEAPAGSEKATVRWVTTLPANQVLLVALVSVLCAVGLVMVLSASSVESFIQYGSSWYVFKRQVLWVGLGVALFFLVSRIDYRAWRRVASPLLIVCVVLLAAVLIPHVGATVGGSSRWIGVGFLRIQPSELTKLALVVFGADLLTRRVGPDRWGRPQRWAPAVRPLLIAMLLTSLLILKQPDMGTAMVLAAMTLGLLCAAGAPGRVMAALAGAGGALGLVVALAEPYRRARLLSFINPWAHRSNSGYQVVQSLVGFASGHLFGVGLGASRAKWGFLPNAHTDFIFSIIGEELGLVGSLLVVALFAALAVVGLRIAARAPDRFGSLMAVGVTVWLTSQAVLNMGAVIGLLPVTGVPLPFVSYGGSSLVIEMAAAGILFNVARRSKVPLAGRGGGATRPGSAPNDLARQGGHGGRGAAPYGRPAHPVGAPRREVGAGWSRDGARIRGGEPGRVPVGGRR